MSKIKSTTIKGCLTIASVTIIVLFTAFTSQFFVIWPYIGPINTRSIIITLSLNSFLLMIVINYFLTCTTDPGRVPNNWMPRQQAYIEVKKSTHTPRFCRTCKNFKPPRSHHCSRCGRCVLKMDHHCPWVNNCIGFANYGHFIRLLIYINISAVYIFTLLACRLAQLTRSSQFESKQLDITEIVFMSINLMITASAILGVGALSCYHIFYISTNTTTIEAWEKGRSLTIKRMESVKNIKYPYNRGIYKNLTAVLGKRPIFWLIPQPTTGNGFEFSIDDDKFQKYDNVDHNGIFINDTVNGQYSSSTCLNRPPSTLLTDVPYTIEDAQMSIIAAPTSTVAKSKSTGSVTSLLDKTYKGYHTSLPEESIITFSTNATTLIDDPHDVDPFGTSKSIRKFELKEIIEHR